MVGLVVVHAVNTPAVIGGPEITQDSISLLLFLLRKVEYVDVASVPVVNLQCRRGTVFLHGAAIHATVGAAFGRIFPAEPLQVSHG